MVHEREISPRKRVLTTLNLNAESDKKRNYFIIKLVRDENHSYVLIYIHESLSFQIYRFGRISRIVNL